MNKVLVIIFLTVLLASGCSPYVTVFVPTATSLPPFPTPAPTATPVPECISDTSPTFMDYATWTKVNPRPIKGHEVYVNIYVDNLAKGTYLSADGDTFPVCSRIVKTHLAGANSDVVTALTVMVKMPEGYDPEHNDWWWGMYDKDGKVAQMSGKVQVCIACHQPAAAADYVFSQKVLEESQK